MSLYKNITKNSDSDRENESITSNGKACIAWKHVSQYYVIYISDGGSEMTGELTLSSISKVLGLVKNSLHI